MRWSVALLLLIVANASPSAASAAKPGIEKLAWMAGTWTGETQGLAMEEIWSTPRGGGLIGMHKDSRDGRMVSFEFFRVVPDSSGGACYLASPLGKAPAPFCAIELTDSRVVFENRGHDFPQRILYWLESDGLLHARIEGTIGGVARAEDWVWRRARGR